MTRLIELYPGGSRTLVLAGIALLTLWPGTGNASPAAPSPHEIVRGADSDGDGIADDFDPDDDNDGVADDQEGSGGASEPDILDPGKDTDSDGISNVLDPDDNNNAVTDENNPTSFPPSNNGGGSSNPPETGGGSSNPPNTASGSSNLPSEAGTSFTTSHPTTSEDTGYFVQALPVTGSGAEPAGWRPVTGLGVLAMVLWLAAVQTRVFNRRWSRD